MTDDKPPASTRGWHIAQWPPLAWLETGIKLAAIVIGIVALVQALVTANFRFPTDLRLIQFATLLILSIVLLAAILDRYLEREIVAMVFVLLNNLAHWGMVVSLASQPGPGWLLLAFVALMPAGDAVKLVFLRVEDFSIRDTARLMLFGLTSFYIVGYLVVLLSELILVFGR
jgi:hypothetical protein